MVIFNGLNVHLQSDFMQFHAISRDFMRFHEERLLRLLYTYTKEMGDPTNNSKHN